MLRCCFCKQKKDRRELRPLGKSKDYECLDKEECREVAYARRLG